MKILLSGATGLIGKKLIERLLKDEHSLTLLSRNPSSSQKRIPPEVEIIEWDAMDLNKLKDKINAFDAIINLAGEPIAAKRWTKSQKETILSSRINSTKALVTALSKAKTKPKVFINASAVGFYGNVQSDTVTESYKKGNGFLPEVCTLWEKEANKAKDYCERVVLLRIGIVLDKNGGALEKIIPPFLIFAGGPLGSGKQWFPWIHIDDVVGTILFSLNNKEIEGPINLASPGIVNMKGFCSELGNALNRPSWAPVPGFALNILLGEMAEMLLSGQKAVPEKLLQAGYNFKFPELKKALNQILN